MEFNELLNEFNLSPEFTLDVIDELDNVNDSVLESDIKGRTDLRKINTFTIDGEDAKDLDDAVSVELLENGNYLLGVHIADVSHYVKENTALDREAQERGTSVYLVDKVIPMLPVKLSNGICSLNPDVDRLTMTAFMEINDRGNVVDYSLTESVIRSKRRMTYTEVTKILEGEAEGYEKSFVDDLLTMKELALKLRDKRIRRGSLEFDIPETKIITDFAGKPVEIKKYELSISNHMIEEFMLCANETVARHMCNAEIPMVYRVHEKPSSDKIKSLSVFLQSMGYNLRVKDNVSPNRLQAVLDKVRGTEVEPIVSIIMLRSMMKARYCEENLGHFGLAATFYCHFTSPIRRYPDLAVHRILKASMKGELTSAQKEHFAGYAVRVSADSSDAEVNATEAERKWRDVKICEYMKDLIGEAFDGVISSVTSFGLYVELPFAVDGLVPMRDLTDDYYLYNEDLCCLVGKHTGRVFRIGDSVRVKLVRVNQELLQIDFVLDEANDKKTIKHKRHKYKRNSFKKSRSVKKTGRRGRRK